MRSNTNAHDSGASSHVQGVNATSGGLVKSTLAAAAVAGAILTFAWLPAEYGIDPTGVGHVLGLTEMGEIKEQLHREADADAAAEAAADAAATATASDGASAASASSTASDNAELISRLDAIDTRLAAIEASVVDTSQTISTPSAPAGEEVPATQPETAVVENTEAPTAVPTTVWRDEVEYTLTPGEGVEVKLVMNEGASAKFEWSANGAVVNYDTHGHGGGQKISYEKGRSVPEQAGQLVAAFTGNHGWFWRNRTDDSVVLTLRTRGDYSDMVKP